MSLSSWVISGLCDSDPEQAGQCSHRQHTMKRPFSGHREPSKGHRKENSHASGMCSQEAWLPQNLVDRRTRATRQRHEPGMCERAGKCLRKSQREQEHLGRRELSLLSCVGGCGSRGRICSPVCAFPEWHSSASGERQLPSQEAIPRGGNS